MILTKAKMYGVKIIVILILSDLCLCDEEDLIPERKQRDSCGYESCSLIQPGMLNVHIVPHTHYEYGFHKTFYEHYTGYYDTSEQTDINMKRTLDVVITELWSDEKRKFTISDFPYFFHWWAQRDSSVRRMVYQLIRQGRLHFVGGGWGMPDESSTSYHAIIEAFTYSLRKLNATFTECGRPLVAWQADCFGHSREFTSLVAQMGFDGLFINPISFDDELARMRRLGLEFIWRGSDDLGRPTDIFTHKLFDGYWSPPGFCFSSHCSDPLLVSHGVEFKNVKERVNVFIDSMLQRQAPNYNTSHVMVIMGKVFAYFDAGVWFANIDRLIREVNERSFKAGKKVHLLYSNPACYLMAVHQSKPWLETKQDDFIPIAYDHQTYLTGSFTSHPSLKLIIREALVYLQMVKQLQVLARLENNEKIFEEFKWIFSLVQDHSIITGALQTHVKSYYVQKLHLAIQKSTIILKQAFNKLMGNPKWLTFSRCDFNISSCDDLNGENAFIVIYNPLAWFVTIPVRLPVLKSGDYTIYDGYNNKIPSSLIPIPEPVQRIPLRKAADHEVVFMAEDLPPLGYRCYFFERNHRRRRRATVLKNLNRRHSKKYLVRQVNTQADEQSLLNELDYEYFEDETTPVLDANLSEATRAPERQAKNKATGELHTKIIFGNISKDIPIEADTETTHLPSILFDNLSKSKLHESSIMKTKAPTGMSKKETEEVQIRNMSKMKKIEFGRNKSEIPTDMRVVYRNMTKLRIKDKIDDAIKQLFTSSEPPKIKTNMFQYVPIITDSKIKTNMVQYAPITDTKTTYVPQAKFWKSTSLTAFKNLTVAKKDSTKDINETFDNNLFVREREPSVEFSTSERTLEKKISADKENNINKDTEKRPKFEPDTNKRMILMAEGTMAPEETSDLFFGNEYVRIELDPKYRKISKVTLANGVTVNLDVQFYYYVSDDPTAEKIPGDDPFAEKPPVTARKAPGAMIMRSADIKPIPILDYVNVKLYKTLVAEEYHCQYADWASMVVRMYRDSPVVVIEWTVGPVPVNDGAGKEVFIRYMTDLVNDGVFFTDSNGRQTMKRIRNVRPMFDSVNTDPVAGNLHPVTTKIFIEDKERNIRFSIFPDRATGGTSLYDGEVDLMVQRRILTDDMLFQAYVNDTHDGVGIVVRGKHYLYMSRADYKPNKIYEKKLAKEIELTPQVLVSTPQPYDDRRLFFKKRNQFSFLKGKLPIGVHVLTLEMWSDNTILLRLENYLEKSDVIKTGVKFVRLNAILSNIIIKNAQETTLAGNMWLKNFVPLRWNRKDKFLKNFNEFYGTGKTVEFSKQDHFKMAEPIDVTKSVKLIPQQIRTFVCSFEYSSAHDNLRKFNES